MEFTWGFRSIQRTIVWSCRRKQPLFVCSCHRSLHKNEAAQLQSMYAYLMSGADRGGARGVSLLQGAFPTVGSRGAEGPPQPCSRKKVLPLSRSLHVRCKVVHCRDFYVISPQRVDPRHTRTRTHTRLFVKTCTRPSPGALCPLGGPLGTADTDLCLRLCGRNNRGNQTSIFSTESSRRCWIVLNRQLSGPWRCCHSSRCEK